MRKLGIVIVGMFAVAALAAAPAAAKPGHGGPTCTGTLASGKYHRLTVPSGETCDGTEARIDVRAGSGLAMARASSSAPTPARGA